MEPRQLKFIKDTNYDASYLQNSFITSPKKSSQANVTRLRNVSSSVNDLFANCNISIDQNEEKITFVSPRSVLSASPLIATKRQYASPNSKNGTPNTAHVTSNNAQSIFYSPKPSFHDRTKINGNISRVCHNLSQEDLRGISTNYSVHKNSPNNNSLVKKSPKLVNERSDTPECSKNFKFYEDEEQGPKLMAKKMFILDGYSLEDVAIILGKKNEQANELRYEYKNLFNFSNLSIDEALREFLNKVVLFGESQERERILECFSSRYSDFNENISAESSHTLTCAMVLLNTDLYGQNIGSKMSLSAFTKNLSGLNNGQDFNEDILKNIYQSIKNKPLPIQRSCVAEKTQRSQSIVTSNALIDININVSGFEFRKGHLLRKCCNDINGQKTGFGKRGWRVFFAILRDMVLFLYKNSTDDITEPTEMIRIHHSLASPAPEYKKRPYILRLQTADQAQYLLQARNDLDCGGWIESLNVAAALLSSPPLAGAVGSQLNFTRPLMPSAPSKNNPVEQLRMHHQHLQQSQKEIKENERNPPGKQDGTKAIQNYVEREFFWKYEHLRFSTYCQALHRFLQSPLGKSGKFYSSNIHRAGSDRMNQFDRYRKTDKWFSTMTSAHSVPAIIFETRV